MNINLELRMKQAGITGKQLAEEISVWPSTVSNWKRNNFVSRKHSKRVIETLTKYREPAKPRTKIRKAVPKESDTTVTLSMTLEMITKIMRLPADNDTKLHLIKTLTSTGESR